MTAQETLTNNTLRAHLSNESADQAFLEDHPWPLICASKPDDWRPDPTRLYRSIPFLDYISTVTHTIESERD